MTTTTARPSAPCRATPLLDMAAGYNVSAPLEIRFQARNLLNEEYLASQDVRTVSAPGRSASITLAVKF